MNHLYPSPPPSHPTHPTPTPTPLLLQRPLKAIAIASASVYIPRGVAVPALDRKALWEFEPAGLSETHYYPASTHCTAPWGRVYHA